MLKKALLVATALTASIASADININWFASLGFYNNGTGPAPADPSDYMLFGGGDATAQLIWRPTNDPIVNTDLSPSTPGFVTGDDIVLNTTTVSGNDYGFYSVGVNLYTDAAFSGQTGGVALDQGFVYARIFAGASPTPGEYWNASRILDPALFDPGNPATEFLDANTGAAIGDELDLLIVPEPSVLAFLGLGGLALAFRRRR